MVIIGGEEVKSILQGTEREVIAAVSSAYMTHAAGNSSLPYSLFLRFPCNPHDRIIALPAHLGGGHPLTGINWISSFPANVRIGLDRASAVLIVNSSSTGHPEAILEGSVISAKRTAASAVGDLVLSSARKEGRGLQMASFVPEAWSGQEHV
jgi:ornithine cyclodeaminase